MLRITKGDGNQFRSKGLDPNQLSMKGCAFIGAIRPLACSRCWNPIHLMAFSTMLRQR
jgi:hypothetical protein